MVWNVFSIELIQKLTPEKFVLMDQGQRLESLVLIGFCNERAGVALGCERAAEHGKTLSCFSCPENCVHCVSGAFGEELLGMGEGGTDARIAGGGTWPPASLVQCCAIIKCSGNASLPEILDSPPSCCLPHAGICVPPLLSVLP